MTVEEIGKKYDCCKRADLVLLEKLENRIDLLEKVIINLCNRVEYLESRGN